MKRMLSLSLFLISLALAQTVSAVELKIATIAPQGSTLFDALQQAANEIQNKTANKVTIKLFGGAVLGEDKEIVGKMRYGEIDGAALTGVGLGMIEPEIRALELPFLFENATEVDKVYAQMAPYFTNKFSQKGFELLGWSEIGFIKIFSNKAIRNKDDLKGLKMWMWEGDLLAKTMYDELSVTPIPLSIADVLPSLQTSVIDVVYGPETGAVAFQWQTATKFMTDVNLINGTGGIVLTSKAWNKISAGDKAIVKEVMARHSALLTQKTRQDNLTSRQALQNSGVQFVTMDAKAMQDLKTVGNTVRQKLVGQLYSQQVLDQITAALQ